MKYKHFKQLLESIKETNDREEAFNKALDPFNDSYNIFCFSSKLQSSVMKYLKDVFEDEGTWIDYWVYELDFGTRTDLGASYKDGTPIKLNTMKDLYKFLLKNMAEK